MKKADSEHFLYGLKWPGRGIQYVGVAVDPSRRLSEHRRGCGSRPNYPLTNALVGQSVELVLLARGRREAIYGLEMFAIEEFKTLRPHGYNRSSGGVQPS